LAIWASDQPGDIVSSTNVVEATYDYLVLGGGTAGCVVGSRLSENPQQQVAILEWGPTDRDEERANDLRRWPEMLEGEYDLDYESVAQQRGNSHIRHARLRILGGCSTANTMIAWKPLPTDLDEWVSLGANGWEPHVILPYYDRVLAAIQPVAEQDRSPRISAVVESASIALDLPLREQWNDPAHCVGAGYFEVGYRPDDHQRSSASHSYIHSVATQRPNLTVIHERRSVRLLIEDGHAVGAVTIDGDGVEHSYRARREVIVCCGAIDSPRLLQLSGIGPAAVLRAAGVSVVVDLPGVGENLQDHPEGLVVWEVTGEVGAERASGWDAGYIVDDIDPSTPGPDVSTHIPLETWGVHVERLIGPLPERTMSVAPNVAKPRSRGRVWITSSDPAVAPLLDPRYFTDSEGRDERMLVAGIRNARRVAAQEPFASLVVREVFPGPDVQTAEEISAIQRQVHQTVYHLSGTCKMGSADDPMAVVDPELRVRGVEGLRVVDASIFPTITALNPMVTVLTVAERAADLIAGRRE
jgi:choline dehydrogenase-like flavoprotein